MTLEKILLIEDRVDDEYARNWSDIPRDIFEVLVKADPKSQVNPDGSIRGIGYGAKQLLLKHYQAGDTDFLSDIDSIKEYLARYYNNLGSYEAIARNLGAFPSIDIFKTFVDTGDYSLLQAGERAAEVDNISQIYQKYYSKIPRDIFDLIISIDPQTTEKSIGKVARNLLLPKYISGEDIFFEGQDELKKAIEIFYRDQKKYPEEFQSVESFESVEAFLDYILQETPVDSALVASLKQNETVDPDTHHKVKDDIRVITSTADYDIIQPLSAEANKAITRNKGFGSDNNAMKWCTSSADIGRSFWSRYDSHSNIYCFMHKTRNHGAQNRDVNWQLAVYKRNNEPYEFRDGHDTALSFEDFLFGHPDITQALAKVEPFKDMAVIRKVIDALEIVSKPFEVNSLKDFIRLNRSDKRVKAAMSGVLISNVSYIPANTFADYISLKNVQLNAPLEIIGEQAFLNCVALNNIQFPDTLKEIKARAFSGCIHLKNNIRIPDSLKKIGPQAFLGTHCKLSIKQDRAEKNLPLEVSSMDKDWYLSHMRSVNE